MVSGRSGGGRGRGSRIRPLVPAWAPGPRAALHRARSAAARPGRRSPAPPPSAPRLKPLVVPTAPAPSVLSDTPRAFPIACPHPGPRPRKHPDPLVSFCPRCQNFSKQVQPGPRRSGRPSLTLSRQLTFSVGYTTFPQRAHWGFIVAVPRGGGGGGWGLRGAAVTSPGEPRTSGREAGGREPRSRVSAGPGASRPRGARGGRRGRCGAWRLGAAALSGSGSAPARAARRSLCVARTPGTGDSHRHSLPPLALTRSPASQPPRRPNPPARPDRSGRERARRAPRREG